MFSVYFLSLPSPIPTDVLPATVLTRYWIPFDRALLCLDVNTALFLWVNDQRDEQLRYIISLLL